MPLKIKTSLKTLMILAGELGQARKSGDKELIAEAERKHDEYRDLCLREDVEMITEFTVGDLSADMSGCDRRNSINHGNY